MKNKKFLFAGLSIALVFALTGCQKLDVVGTQSIASFKEVLRAIPDNVGADERNGGWALTAPDESVKFIWSEDFSKSPIHDVMLEFDAKPFVDAGLDVSKLPAGMAYDDMIMVGTKLGEATLEYSDEATPLASYEHIVTLNRESIKYHTALDHYGVDLAGGNMFEWAKDMSNNDKDIVFVLNPEPFIAAGMDPNAVDGWVFTKVPVEVDGKATEVDKLLKPFDLK